MPRPTQITNAATLSAAEDRARDGMFIIIYVSSSPIPACKAFTPKFEALAQRPEYSHVDFCQMEFDIETTPLLKFGAQNTPILILMRSGKAETLLSPRLEVLEEKMRGYL